MSESSAFRAMTLLIVMGVLDRTNQDRVSNAVSVDVSRCEHQGFEATVTNGGASDVGVHISFSQYFPDRLAVFFSEPNIGAGETVTITQEFADPDLETPLDCAPFVTVVPVPVG